MKKKLLLFTLPLLGVLLLAGCTVNVKQDNPTPDISVGARTGGGAFRGKTVGGSSIASLQPSYEAATPATNKGADLGSSSLWWDELYVGTAYIETSTIGTVTVSSTVSGTTTFDGIITGPIQMEQDGGVLELVDMPVTITTPGVAQGYGFQIDNVELLTLKAYPDGLGSVTTSTIDIKAGTTRKSVAISSAYNFNGNVEYILADTTGAALTVTLATNWISTLSSATQNGRVCIIDAGGNAGANNITIATEGAETISNSAANQTIGVNNTSRCFIANGTEVFIE